MPEDQYGNYQCILTPAGPDNPSGLPIGSGGISSITYVGPPNGTPPAFDAIVADVNGRVWVYFNGQWN